MPIKSQFEIKLQNFWNYQNFQNNRKYSSEHNALKKFQVFMFSKSVLASF